MTLALARQQKRVATTTFSVAMDQFGAASQDVHALVRAFAIRQARLSDGLYTVSSCVARWRQKLPVVLQRSISDVVIGDWATTASAAGGAPAPVFDAYKRISLLRPRAAAGVAPAEPPD